MFEKRNQDDFESKALNAFTAYQNNTHKSLVTSSVALAILHLRKIYPQFAVLSIPEENLSIQKKKFADKMLQFMLKSMRQYVSTLVYIEMEKLRTKNLEEPEMQKAIHEIKNRQAAILIALQFHENQISQKMDQYDEVILYLWDPEKQHYANQTLQIPLREVLVLVWHALLDDAKYGHPKEIAKAEKLSRITSFFYQLYDHANESICHHGQRNAYLLSLNKSFPGIDIVFDERLLVLEKCRKYFEDHLIPVYEASLQDKLSAEALQSALLTCMKRGNAEELFAILDPQGLIQKEYKNILLAHGCNPEHQDYLKPYDECLAHYSLPKEIPGMPGISYLGRIFQYELREETSKSAQALAIAQASIAKQDLFRLDLESLEDTSKLFEAHDLWRCYENFFQISGTLTVELSQIPDLLEKVIARGQEEKGLIRLENTEKELINKLLAQVKHVERDKFFNLICDFFVSWYGPGDKSLLYRNLISSVFEKKVKMTDDECFQYFQDLGVFVSHQDDLYIYKINRLFLNAIMYPMQTWPPHLQAALYTAYYFIKNIFVRSDAGEFAGDAEQYFPKILLDQIAYLLNRKAGQAASKVENFDIIMPNAVQSAMDWVWVVYLGGLPKVIYHYYANANKILQFFQENKNLQTLSEQLPLFGSIPLEDHHLLLRKLFLNPHIAIEAILSRADESILASWAGDDSIISIIKCLPYSEMRASLMKKLRCIDFLDPEEAKKSFKNALEAKDTDKVVEAFGRGLLSQDVKTYLTTKKHPFQDLPEFVLFQAGNARICQGLEDQFILQEIFFYQTEQGLIFTLNRKQGQDDPLFKTDPLYQKAKDPSFQKRVFVSDEDLHRMRFEQDEEILLVFFQALILPQAFRTPLFSAKLNEALLSAKSETAFKIRKLLWKDRERLSQIIREIEGNTKITLFPFPHRIKTGAEWILITDQFNHQELQYYYDQNAKALEPLLLLYMDQHRTIRPLAFNMPESALSSYLVKLQDRDYLKHFYKPNGLPKGDTIRAYAQLLFHMGRLNLIDPSSWGQYHLSQALISYLRAQSTEPPREVCKAYLEICLQYGAAARLQIPELNFMVGEYLKTGEIKKLFSLIQFHLKPLNDYISEKKESASHWKEIEKIKYLFQLLETSGFVNAYYSELRFLGLMTPSVKIRFCDKKDRYIRSIEGAQKLLPMDPIFQAELQIATDAMRALKNTHLVFEVIGFFNEDFVDENNHPVFFNTIFLKLMNPENRRNFMLTDSMIEQLRGGLSISQYAFHRILIHACIVEKENWTPAFDKLIHGTFKCLQANMSKFPEESKGDHFEGFHFNTANIFIKDYQKKYQKIFHQIHCYLMPSDFLERPEFHLLVLDSICSLPEWISLVDRVASKKAVESFYFRYREKIIDFLAIRSVKEPHFINKILNSEYLWIEDHAFYLECVKEKIKGPWTYSLDVKSAYSALLSDDIFAYVRTWSLEERICFLANAKKDFDENGPVFSVFGRDHFFDQVLLRDYIEILIHILEESNPDIHSAINAFFIKHFNYIDYDVFLRLYPYMPVENFSFAESLNNQAKQNAISETERTNGRNEFRALQFEVLSETCLYALQLKKPYCPDLGVILLQVERCKDLFFLKDKELFTWDTGNPIRWHQLFLHALLFPMVSWSDHFKQKLNEALKEKNLGELKGIAEQIERMIELQGRLPKNPLIIFSHLLSSVEDIQYLLKIFHADFVTEMYLHPVLEKPNSIGRHPTVISYLENSLEKSQPEQKNYLLDYISKAKLGTLLGSPGESHGIFSEPLIGRPNDPQESTLLLEEEKKTFHQGNSGK